MVDYGYVKPSRYNLMEKEKNGIFLLANTLSGALIRVKYPMYRKIRNILSKSSIDPSAEDKKSLMDLLIDNGFLIPVSHDEISFLRKLHEESRNGKNALGLGIGLTQDCNFECSYCYQEHVGVDISEGTMEGLIRYVEKNLRGRDILYINWFGGEPLLRLKKMDILSKGFITICKEYGSEYYSTITTNGYLLTLSTARVLRENNVKEVQVTLDGPRYIHDRRRHLRTGRGTFRIILDNIIASASLFEEFIIRINIDKENCNTIEELLDILVPVREDIVIAFRPATSPDTPDKTMACCLPSDEFFALEKSLIEKATERGFRIQNGCAIPGTSFCSAYQRNAIMVDAYGDVHLCPVCSGRRGQRIGVLTKDGTVARQRSIQTEWNVYSPLDDPLCSECIALPVCMGGCLWYVGRSKRYPQRCYLKHSLIERLKTDHTMNRFISNGSVPVIIY